MAVNKSHNEFYAVDLSSGWEVPPRYPEGIQKKILSGTLDEDRRAAAGPGSCDLTRYLHDTALRARLLGISLSGLRRLDRRQ